MAFLLADGKLDKKPVAKASLSLLALFSDFFELTSRRHPRGPPSPRSTPTRANSSIAKPRSNKTHDRVPMYTGVGHRSTRTNLQMPENESAYLLFSVCKTRSVPPILFDVRSDAYFFSPRVSRNRSWVSQLFFCTHFTSSLLGVPSTCSSPCLSIF